MIHSIGLTVSIITTCAAAMFSCARVMAEGPTTKPWAFFIVDDSVRTPASALCKSQLDGSGLVKLTKIGPMNIEKFWVSDDGRQIIGYRASDFGLPYSGKHAKDLVMMDADGTITRTIDLSGMPLIWPSSPPMLLADGKHIGFVAVQPDPNDRNIIGGASMVNIVTMDLEGKDVKTVAKISDNCSSACWSPDGNRILYTVDTIFAREGHSYLQHRLWEMNADGSNQRTIFAANTAAGWYSPDGRRICYLRVGRDAAEIMVADADGRHSRQVTTIGARLSSPRWLADGKTIVFFKTENTKAVYGTVWAVEADGKNLRRLSPFGEMAWMDRSADRLWYPGPERD